MLIKPKTCFVCIMAFLMLSLAALATPVKAAGAITVTPNTLVSPGATVTISATGFGTVKPVGVGFGSQTSQADLNMAYSGTGTGPYNGTITQRPVKPGSFLLYSDTSSGGGLVSTYSDNGDGTTTGSYAGSGNINYVTGYWDRSTTVDVTGIATNYSATYTSYQYAVTPTAGITTNSTGGFTATITVPSAVANGIYTVTAIDSQGNLATAQIGVGVAIPESLTVGAVVLLSSVAVVSGAFLLRKPKVKSLDSAKL